MYTCGSMIQSTKYHSSHRVGSAPGVPPELGCPPRDLVRAPADRAQLEGLQQRPGVEPALVTAAVAASHHSVRDQPREPRQNRSSIVNIHLSVYLSCHVRYVPVAELAGVHEFYLRPVGHLGVVVLLEDVSTSLATVILSPTLRLRHLAWIQSMI